MRRRRIGTAALRSDGVGWWLGALALLWAGAAQAADDEIKLKRGPKFSATVVGKDAERIMLAVPRSAVEMINGAPLPAPVAAGSAAPDFTAVDVNGVAQRLAGSKSRATLLQFWATWCPHCRSDLALMKDLLARYQPRGLRVLTVSIDRDPRALQSFLERERVPYPVIPTSGPSVPPAQAGLPELYEMQGVPAYYLIDSKGVIAQTLSGSVTERPHPDRDLDGAIQPLLASSTPPPALK